MARMILVCALVPVSQKWMPHQNPSKLVRMYSAMINLFLQLVHVPDICLLRLAVLSD